MAAARRGKNHRSPCEIPIWRRNAEIRVNPALSSQHAGGAKRAEADLFILSSAIIKRKWHLLSCAGVASAALTPFMLEMLKLQ